MQSPLHASYQQLRKGALSTWQQGGSNVLEHMAGMRSDSAAAWTDDMIA